MQCQLRVRCFCNTLRTPGCQDSTYLWQWFRMRAVNWRAALRHSKVWATPLKCAVEEAFWKKIHVYHFTGLAFIRHNQLNVHTIHLTSDLSRTPKNPNIHICTYICLYGLPGQYGGPSTALVINYYLLLLLL